MPSVKIWSLETAVCDLAEALGTDDAPTRTLLREHLRAAHDAARIPLPLIERRQEEPSEAWDWDRRWLRAPPRSRAEGPILEGSVVDRPDISSPIEWIPCQSVWGSGKEL